MNMKMFQLEDSPFVNNYSVLKLEKETEID